MRERCVWGVGLQDHVVAATLKTGENSPFIVCMQARRTMKQIPPTDLELKAIESLVVKRLFREEVAEVGNGRHTGPQQVANQAERLGGARLPQAQRLKVVCVYLKMMPQLSAVRSIGEFHLAERVAYKDSLDASRSRTHTNKVRQVALGRSNKNKT